MRGEKIYRRNTKIFAYCKKDGKGRVCLPVFDMVDIGGVLPDRKTHVTGGDAFCIRSSDNLWENSSSYIRNTTFVK